MIFGILSGGHLSGEGELQEAAEILSENSEVGPGDLISSVMEKSLRLFICFTLAGIIWDGLNIKKSLKNSARTIKNHPSEFIIQFGFTELVGLLVFLPSTLLLFLGIYLGASGGSFYWLVVILFAGFAWIYCSYCEQYFMGIFYLWDKNWKKVQAASSERIPLQSVPKPSLLDEINEFALDKNSNN